MPDVALGRAQWSPEEAEHLATCAGCQEEWSLVRLAGGLGEQLRLAAEPDSIATAVFQRIASERRQARYQRWSVAGLAAAAAIALAVWYGRGQTGQNALKGLPVATAPAAQPAELAIPLPELDQLQEPELDSLLQEISPPLTSGSTLEAPSLGDLDDQELEEVLATWEG
jgi:hypothetical protein